MRMLRKQAKNLTLKVIFEAGLCWDHPVCAGLGEYDQFWGGPLSDGEEAPAKVGHPLSQFFIGDPVVLTQHYLSIGGRKIEVTWERESWH